jgi:hypothetical protein
MPARSWPVVFLFLSTLVVAGLPGCASTGVKNPFAAAGKRNSSLAAAKPVQTGEDPSQAPPASKPAKPGGPQPFDHETLTLIDKELRDASPDERDALYAELKSISPDMVKEVLRIRRMGLNFREQQRLAERSTESPAGAEADLVAGTAERATDPGLGENPWAVQSRQTTARPILGGHSGTMLAQIEAPAPNGRTAITPPDQQASNPPSGPAAAPMSPAVQPAQAVNTAASPVVTASATAQPASPGVSNPVSAATSPAATTQPGTNPNPMGVNPATPMETAPLPQPASARADLIPGQYNPGQLNPGAAVTAFGQPVVANVQKALQEIPKPRLPWGQSPDTPASSTAPVAATPTPQDRVALGQVIDELEQQVAQAKPGTTPEELQIYIEKHVHLRLLYLLAGQQERSLQAIPGIPAADQEFWQQTLWGLSNYFDSEHLPRETDRATQTVAQMATAVSRLRQKAALELRNVGFCQRINNFGSYERFERDEFAAGQPVLLYAEVENFFSEPTSDGQYRTLLKSTLEIYRPGKTGDLVDRFEFPATEDLCRNPRRDYFHSYEFTIPTKLGLGPHILKLTVEDQLTRRVMTQSINFSVK